MAASKGPTAPETAAVCVSARCPAGTHTNTHAVFSKQVKECVSEREDLNIECKSENILLLLDVNFFSKMTAF